MAEAHTAETVRKALRALAKPEAKAGVAKFYKGTTPGNQILGVPIGSIFPAVKGFAGLDTAEIEVLMDDRHYEVRMAAMAIMDFTVRAKRTPDEVRGQMYDLYLRRHDRIDNWDLVDRAAPHVIGEYLVGRDRKVLHRLAKSGSPWERRTAIVSTHAFIKRGETADTFAIAGLLAGDADPYVQMAVASWTREAGKRDAEALVAFLSAHKAKLPARTLREASKILPDSARVKIGS